jgi:hypothetical protein
MAQVARNRDVQTFAPRAPRRPNGLLADMSGPTVAPFKARVYNIFGTGMLIETVMDVRVGDVLTAKLPGQRATLCTVVRTRADTAGLRFVREED